ncbi:MAG: hypothetical protein ACM3UZ_15740 [Acidobacteriota bacterium]
MFFNNGFPFVGGYWVADGKKLEEIISWNQRLLEKKFKLGLTQNVEHDYRQILLRSAMYRHMRLFWLMRSNYIDLFLLVPESDVLIDCEKFLEEQITPLSELACKVWETGLPSLIQTSLEMDSGGIEMNKVLHGGNAPAYNPFAVVKKETYSKIKLIPGNIDVYDIKSAGMLIVDRANITHYPIETLTDEKLESILNNTNLDADEELENILQILTAIKDNRLLSLVKRLIKSYRWKNLWEAALCCASAIDSEEAENFFINFLVNDDKLHPRLTNIADEYLRKR